MDTGYRPHAKLHIGCGQVRLDGWINIDEQPLPGVDEVLDIRHGIPFLDVELIFAEHFIEHLRYDDALFFLRECRRVMRDDGVLRLTTPNLDWVWATHYPLPEFTGDLAERACFALNTAFHGWGHQFLYNLQTLEQSLRRAGFSEVKEERYGESSRPALRGLEQHELYRDDKGYRHLLVVEASGRAVAASGDTESLAAHLAAIDAR